MPEDKTLKLKYTKGKEYEFFSEYCEIKYGDKQKKGITWRLVEGRFTIFKRNKILLQFNPQ